MRNQDEFYYAMENARTSGGVSRRLKDPNIARNRASSSIRDAGLVATKLGMEIGRTRRLAENLHFFEEAAECSRTHIVFVSDDELDDAADPTPVSSELLREGEAVQEEAEEDAGEEEDEGQDDNEEYYEEEYEDPKILRARKKAYKELELRKERVAKLRSVAQDIATERNLQGKGARYKVRDADPSLGTPAVYKWRQQRKK